MMASAASVASSVNTTSGLGPTSGPASAQKDGPHRPLKQNQTPKMTQKGRKESPSDTNRQTTTPKAWSGPNPITQRASTPNQSKGNMAQSKNTPPSKPPSAKETLSDKHNYDRLRFLFGGSIGLQVILVTKAGDKYEGVFAGYAASANGYKMVLQMTKKVITSPITQPNGITSWDAAFAGSSPDHAMTFELKDMADMTIPEFSLPQTSKPTNGASSSFQTDADISGNAARGERVLQRWVPDAAETGDFALEAGSASGWDQFATHEKMTGGQSTYTEETYTTIIDRSAPDFRRREADAVRIAREIEGQSSTNSHVREERGQALANDYEDEEDKYSGVRRDRQSVLPLSMGGADRYTPPALRAPSAQTATAGVPVDPAIISSQLARPDPPHASGPSPSISSKPDAGAGDKGLNQPRAASMIHHKKEEAANGQKSLETSKATANGSVSKSFQAKQTLPTLTAQHPPETEVASQGVETKVLEQFRKFADAERARLTEKKRVQASQDRTAKINDLLRFAKTFKLKTPIPNDLVGILAKDPKKQEAIIEKAQRDHEDAQVTSTTSPPTPTSLLPSVPKFDKSQIPPPIPERNTFTAARSSYTKPLGRGQRPAAQQLPFAASGVPVAPRGQSSKTAQIPAPIPMPEPKLQQSASGNSGLSSPRGTDTPSSAVSTKFNVRAIEFRPTAAPFNPSTASVSAASPSPIRRTASIVRTASPSSFFGQRKPKDPSERLDITKHFDPIGRMKEETKSNLEKEPRKDFAPNGGIPNAFHTQPTWLVSTDNQEKTYHDLFNRSVQSTSPIQSRTSSHHTAPFHGQMQPTMGGVQHMAQAVTPQHGPHGGPHYQPHFDDQRMHMQNGSSSMFATPNMTPRGAYASPMGHPTQLAYGQQSYFGGVGPMPMRPYGNNVAMMHGQHGHMGAPMMIQQQSSGPYINIQNQMGMVFGSPRPGNAYPQQQNGYGSPGPQLAPMMMHQNSQQGYHSNSQMMYTAQGHANSMYGQQPQMGRAYVGSHTPYGTSPHQPHHMGQRAMSSGYGQKGIPQMQTNGGLPNNTPQQPAAFGQMQGSDEAK